MSTNQPKLKAKIGILALQGDFQEHSNILESMGCSSVIEVRLPEHLIDIDGLIIPGGESTTISKLIENYDFTSSLNDYFKENIPIGGTCAGSIIIAKNAAGLEPWKPLNFIDISIQRNGYGRQLDSFQTSLNINKLPSKSAFEGVFIRAPKIIRVGKGVEILSVLDNEDPVAVQQKNVLATTFHPELTRDFRFHQLFLDLVSKNLLDQIKEE